MKIFNKLNKKNNYRVVETNSSFEKYRLEFNIFKNIWLPVRDWDKQTKYFNIINFIYFQLFYIFNIFTMFFNVNIVNIFILALFIFHIIIFYFVNEPLTYGCKDDYKKDLDIITKSKNKNKKVVVRFDTNGNELTGQNLKRANKLNNLI